MIFKNRTILPLNTVNISCLERCNKKVFQNFLTSHCFVISKLLEKFFTKNSCYNLLFYCLTIYTLWLNSSSSHRTSRRIRPPPCLTNTFCVAQPLWLLNSQLFQPSLFHSFSTWSSHSSNWWSSVAWGLLWSPLAFGPMGNYLDFIS